MTKSRTLLPVEFSELADAIGGPFVPPFTSHHLWQPAEVRLAGDRIVYRDEIGQRSGAPITAAREMLERFVTLASDGNGRRIQTFARAWGPLRVCRHDFSMLCCPRRCSEPRLMPGLAVGGLYAHWEPLETWRRVAREANALLSMGADLHRGRTVSHEDAETFHDVARFYARAPLSKQRMLYAMEVYIWLMRAGTRPWLTWEGKRISGLGYDGVYGAIGAQLFSVVGTPFAMCAGCGNLRRLRRLPPTGVRSWCDHCRKGRRGAEMARDYRARRREAQRLHRDGVVDAEIAKRLGRSTSQVRAWVSMGRKATTRQR